jgi:hypothetical protein
LPFLEISSVTGAGIEELRYKLRDQLFKEEPVEATSAVTIEDGS